MRRKVKVTVEVSAVEVQYTTLTDDKVKAIVEETIASIGVSDYLRVGESKYTVSVKELKT